MNDVAEHLAAGAYAATVLIGLTLAIAWRQRLARAAAPAIAGFGVLLALLVGDLAWDPDLQAAATGPEAAAPGVRDLLAAFAPHDLAIALATAPAYAIGVGLLILAVLRGPRRDGTG